MAAERRFRAMGTDVEIVVVGDPVAGPAIAEALADAALDGVALLERRWSRFLADSDVSRLNRAAASDDPTPVAVGADTVRLVRRAIDAWRLSAGSVDCTELNALIAAGYDRSFDELPDDRPAAKADGDVRRPRSLAGPADIVIDGRLVTLPPHTGFDPGGIGKGYAADLIADAVMAAGAAGVCINVGGDLRVRGAGPNGTWTISIDLPDGVLLGRIGLTEGAVASSTTLRRTWRVDGERRHHLIDPHTGRPSDTDLVFATAIAAEGWQAEALAKAVLLHGGPHPFDVVDGTGAAALAVDRDGRVLTSDTWHDFTGGAATDAFTGPTAHDRHAPTHDQRPARPVEEALA